MKRLVSLPLMLLLLWILPTVTDASVSDIKSETYVVMDAQTGQVLAQKNADQSMFPASITKILTCGLALAHGKATDTTTMSADAVFSVGRDTTHIALTDGEVVPIDALLNATIIQSANDAANGLAEYVSGNIPAFTELMNTTAVRAGAKNSHFTNANGLHDPNHYTTAYDMAMITRWALTVPGFRELFGAVEYTMAPTNKQPQSRYFGTKHHMLVDSAYYYEGSEGGKLGWTPEAKHTLVTLAKRNDMELICVVMKTSNPYDKYRDTAALLDDCFTHFIPTVFEGSAFAREPISVYEDGKVIASVKLSAQDIRVDRPSTVSKMDIIPELVAPTRYESGEPITPVARFTDRKGTLLCEVPLQFELTDPVQSADLTSSASAAPSVSSWIFFALAGVAFCVAILFGIRARNLRERELERLRRMRRRKHLDAMASSPISTQNPE